MPAVHPRGSGDVWQAAFRRAAAWQTSIAFSLDFAWRSSNFAPIFSYF
jgi:hypothetical protein